MKPDAYPADPEHLWEHFYRIAQIPRPSKAEDAVRDYVIGQAEAHDYRWQPDFASPLLARGKALHQRLFGSEPAVKAIHAGLECGILKSKKPELDILSFGPTIRGAHSPTERLRIDTVPPFWHYLTALLAEL